MAAGGAAAKIGALYIPDTGTTCVLQPFCSLTTASVMDISLHKKGLKSLRLNYRLPVPSYELVACTRAGELTTLSAKGEAVSKR